MTIAMAIGSMALAPTAGAQTFGREIAPLLREHCAVCHRTGGAAPFPLVSYADARSRASLIAIPVFFRNQIARFTGFRRRDDKQTPLQTPVDDRSDPD